MTSVAAGFRRACSHRSRIELRRFHHVCRDRGPVPLVAARDHVLPGPAVGEMPEIHERKDAEQQSELSARTSARSDAPPSRTTLYFGH